MLYRTLPFAFVLLGSTALAAPVTLTPADPQPKAGDLAQGLAVAYAYPSDVRTLDDASSALRKARSGPPLKGLSYVDNSEGDKTLTSRSAQKVAASISGYIRFEAAGTFEIDVLSNDGIAVSIGGQPVALYDEIHACEPAGVQEVIVPTAGWYEIEATYFQRKGTACLMMDWDVGGGMAPVPDAAFAFMK
ncbi:MAG: PA14 domain-containing protein [Pseudomonadota bacterium]